MDTDGSDSDTDDWKLVTGTWKLARSAPGSGVDAGEDDGEDHGRADRQGPADEGARDTARIVAIGLPHVSM